MRKVNLGFTFIELIISISIIGVLALLGVPSYNNIIQNNKQSSALNYFLGSLHFARSEAVKRAKQTMMCPSLDNSTCSASAIWSEGWIMFVDNDQDGDRDNNEQILRAASALDVSLSISGSVKLQNQIRFRGNGISLEDGTVTVCDARGSEKARSIVINLTGRPRISEKNANGGNLTCI